MAGGGSNTLRSVLKELSWSRTRLVAELRRQAANSGDTLPGTESLIAMVSRWVNNHQQPSDFYRDLLARTLSRPRAELFSDEAARLELAAEAEPWLLEEWSNLVDRRSHMITRRPRRSPPLAPPWVAR